MRRISMKKITRAVASSGLFAVLVTSGLALAASPAMAADGEGGCLDGHFCAFDGRSWSAEVLVDTTTTAPVTVDVADNRVASASNNTGVKYCGVNVEGAGNVIRGTIQPTAQIGDFQPYNDTFDFFWVGGAGSC
jgi:hypothetical protein